jgi:hypothetical protein
VLAVASRQAELIPDPKIRKRLQANVGLSSGQIQLAAGRPDLALPELTAAIDYLRTAEYRSSLPLALFLRARASLASADSRSAAEDFAAGQKEIESMRGNLSDEPLRIAFADQAMQAFDEILAFEAGERDGGTAAFHLAEQARGRELLEDLAVAQLTGEGTRAAGPQLLTEPELRNALPAQTLLVKYAVLPDKLLLWTLTRQALTLRTIPIGTQDLEKKVQHALAAMQGAAGPLSESEGFLSLARSFLASGIPAVVATRWNIDDATSRQLVTEFHRRLRSGQDPVTALRWSQVAQAKDQEGRAGHSWNWASTSGS